ncbi:MFS transporter [Mycetocola lacteus]|uniref:MFS transporter n=2 Tax=Mycetocola lacteus TaxID=76637 RepID=A0A3L7AVW8_9MICO|nr:MFS transporter [Mycetocola lacteus]
MAIAQFILALDFSIVNVALWQIQADLGFAAADLPWVATGYALTFGALLIVGGRLGDRFGHRTALLIGLALFGAASLVGGLAPTASLLVAARFVQGAGAALVAPAALAIVRTAYHGSPEQTRALGLFQASAAVGASAGIVLGGILTGLAGWRWVLLINPPLVAALILAILLVAPEGMRTAGAVRASGGLGLLGGVWITVALAAVIFGVTRLEHTPITDPTVWGAGLVAVCAGVACVLGERSSRDPMFPGSLFAAGRWAVIVATLVVGALLGAYVYLIALYLQQQMGMSAIQTGLAMLPATAASFAASTWLNPRLLPRAGTRGQIALALGLMAVGQGTLATLTPASGYVPTVLGGLVLSAIGVGLAYPAAALAITGAVPAHQRGLAGAVFTAGQQVGAALGLAGLATLAAGVSLGWTFVVAAVLALAAALAVLMAMPRMRA